MFKKLTLFTMLFLSFSALADTPRLGDDWSFGSFFTTVEHTFRFVIDFITVDIPNFIDRFFAYLVEFIVLMKVTLLIYSAEAAFSVAKLILSDLGFIQLIEQFAGGIPPDIRNAAVQMKIFQAFNLIVEAYVARLVLSIL